MRVNGTERWAANTGRLCAFALLFPLLITRAQGPHPGGGQPPRPQQSGTGMARPQPTGGQYEGPPRSWPAQPQGMQTRPYQGQMQGQTGPQYGRGQFQGNGFQPNPAQAVGPQGTPAQGSARQGPVQSFWQNHPGNSGSNATRGEHLQQWMQQHGNMNAQQQQQALQREQGFRQLPQETQQRMLNRLDRLNSMPPQQRARVLERSEQMERLNPQQRGQVRSAMGQLGALPQDRRAVVSRSFRELRNLPPQQQNQMLNSPEYRQQFSDEERGTLGNLLSVSPMLPRQ